MACPALYAPETGKKKQLVNLEYQHNIIDAISRIYVTNYVVDLKYKTLEIIRAPEEVHNCEVFTWCGTDDECNYFILHW